MGAKCNDKERAMERLKELLELQKKIELEFGEKDYNVFIFGSYLTLQYQDGKSDIDIAIYSKNFELYKRLSCYLEEYFMRKGIRSDIFYIDTTIEAPVYCAPLTSKVQFTDFLPEELVDFRKRCQDRLEEARMKVVG